MAVEPSIKKPSLFRRTVMGLVNGWRRIMDVRYNPLKYVPDPSLQTYFMLVLFVMWSVFFGFLAANYLGFFNYNTVVSIVIHCAVLISTSIMMPPNCLNVLSRVRHRLLLYTCL